MGLIFGLNGYGKLLAGYPININDAVVKTGSVATDAENGIKPGDLLVFTDKFGVYGVVDSVKSASDYTNKIAGICMSDNVKLDTVFPQKGEVAYMPGQGINVMTRGAVGVEITGAAPVPGAPVYYDIANGKFTTVSTSNLALPNMRFTGQVDGTLAGVEILY